MTECAEILEGEFRVVSEVVRPLRKAYHKSALSLIGSELARARLSLAALVISGFLATPAVASEPLSPATLAHLKLEYRSLIDAENRHDIDAVRQMVWDSPSALFVAKTATSAEGGWAGFWGKEIVLQHLHDLYRSGVFVMAPDYSREKVVGLSKDVAQTYVPLNISVAYAGQSGTPRPFLMIVEWVRTPGGWKMATDIALPVPARSGR